MKRAAVLSEVLHALEARHVVEYNPLDRAAGGDAAPDTDHNEAFAEAAGRLICGAGVAEWRREGLVELATVIARHAPGAVLAELVDIARKVRHGAETMRISMFLETEFLAEWHDDEDLLDASEATAEEFGDDVGALAAAERRTVLARCDAAERAAIARQKHGTTRRRPPRPACERGRVPVAHVATGPAGDLMTALKRELGLECEEADRG